MANFFATGHGLIGGWLKRQEIDDKLKKERDAIADFLVSNGGLDAPSIAAGFPSGQGGKTTVRTQPGLDEYARQLASPPASDESAGNINQRFNAMMRGEAQPAQPLELSAPPISQNTQSAYTTSGRSYSQLPSGIRPPERSPLSPEFVNQQTAALIKKGLDPQRAFQLVSSVYTQRKALEAERQEKQFAPQYMAAATSAFRAGDRAAAFEPIVRLLKMGYKIPVEMLTWIDPNKQRVTNDIGGSEINSSFNPGNGQYSIGQVFQKTQTPDSAARLSLDQSKFGYQQSRDLLGDQGKTWESRRGKNKDEDDSFDPVKTAANTGKYRKFMQELIQDPDTSKYRSFEEVEQQLNNANVRRQMAALASAAGISPEQFRNDIAAIKNKMNQ